MFNILKRIDKKIKILILDSKIMRSLINKYSINKRKIRLNRYKIEATGMKCIEFLWYRKVD